MTKIGSSRQAHPCSFPSVSAVRCLWDGAQGKITWSLPRAADAPQQQQQQQHSNTFVVVLVSNRTNRSYPATDCLPIYIWGSNTVYMLWKKLRSPTPICHCARHINKSQWATHMCHERLKIHSAPLVVFIVSYRWSGGFSNEEYDKST